jgi:hypothetical protein
VCESGSIEGILAPFIFRGENWIDGKEENQLDATIAVY